MYDGGFFLRFLITLVWYEIDFSVSNFSSCLHFTALLNLCILRLMFDHLGCVLLVSEIDRDANTACTFLRYLTLRLQTSPLDR